MAPDHPLSLCLSPVCFLCLKEAFCLVCQGLPEPESTQGCGCFISEPREPHICPSVVDRGEDKRPGVRNCLHVGFPSLVTMKTWLAGSVTFGKLLNLSELPFLHCSMGLVTVPSQGQGGGVGGVS